MLIIIGCSEVFKEICGAVEDNVVAFKLMDENPELTPEMLYTKLEEVYTK